MYFNWSTFQFEEVELSVEKEVEPSALLHELLNELNFEVNQHELPISSSSPSPSKYCTNEFSADDVQALINDNPNAVKKKGRNGLLPLHTAVLNNVPVEVIHVLLKADPSAAQKKGKFKDEHMLPLHFAICEGRSLDMVQALLDVYPKGVEARITKDGKLPLSLCLEFGAPDDVVLTVLEAYPDAAEDCGKHNDVSILPLVTAIRKKRALDIIKELLAVYPDGAKRRLPEGELPLSLAITTIGISDDVALAVLEANPDAAKDMVSNDSSTLPLHLAIQMKRSLDIVQALLDVYPKAAEVTMMRERDEKLPLSHALTSGVSDDVVLALLATFPDAAKAKSLYYYGLEMLPLHFAVRERCSQELVKSLLGAYPVAAKEITATNNLPLHDAVNMNASEGIILLLVDAYPQAAKKRMENGRLPIDACAENNASDELMLALLKVDMPLRIEDGTPLQHSCSWISCVAAQNEGAAVAVQRILSMSEGGFGKHIHALADVCDDEGRNALCVASSGPRSAIYEHLLFSDRYRLKIGPPEHRSKTSLVLRAQDLDEQADYCDIFDNWDIKNNGKLARQDVVANADSIGLDPELILQGSEENEIITKEDFVGICKRQFGDVPRNVAVKLIQSKDQWERECNARKKFNLDPKYVVPALSNMPSEDAIAEAVRVGGGGLDIIKEKFLGGNQPGKHAIVLVAANRNLQQIFYQEQPEIDDVRVMLKQVFEAVKHLHDRKLMHGDLKMANIVRFSIDNQLRLIDFDASARINGEEESFAGAKFSSAILPPEMIERIETEEQLGRFNKYWETGKQEDLYLYEKVKPKLYKKQGITKANYVVKSFRTEGGRPVSEGLPYDLVHASESIDAWALGVLVFTLLTGETLVPSTRDDDCASGMAMHILYLWGTQPDVFSEIFKKIDDDAARDLVQQLLQKEPEKRPTVASLLATHPFFHPKRDDEEMKMFIRQMNARLEDFDTTIQQQAKQLEIINATKSTVTDPEAIENALEERERRRREEGQLEHNENNNQKTAKENTETSAASNPAIAASNNCCAKLMMLFGYSLLKIT